MTYIVELFFFISLAYITSAFELFKESAQQRKPCFEEVHSSGCHSDISEVFSPPYKRSNIYVRNTQVWLFTSANPDKAEPLHKCGGKLPKNSEFDRNVDTIVISHGWLDGLCRSTWMRETKEQLFIGRARNVILTDWTWGNSIDLAAAGTNAIVAGQDIGFVILNIMKQTNQKYGGFRWHFVGHSYGAYVMNAAARYILNYMPENKIDRLTLLDPGIPPFESYYPGFKLNADDVKFMDVIHSDIGECYPDSFGVDTPIGHADFYPKKGDLKVSCPPDIIPSQQKGNYDYAKGSQLFPPFCYNSSSIEYFKVSIKKSTYIAVNCTSFQEFKSHDCKNCCNTGKTSNNKFTNCTLMGLHADMFFPYLDEPRRNRTYYIKVGLKYPYREDYDFTLSQGCPSEEGILII